jgi:hypothetical protein
MTRRIFESSGHGRRSAGQRCRDRVASAALLAWCLAGCDPEGPGASGKISLGPGIDPGAFVTLAIRIFPDRKPDFDPASLPPSEDLERALDKSLGRNSTAAGTSSPLEFPCDYSVGEALGTTPDADWRMVAWLSRQRAPVASIAPGDIFCTTRFKIGDCGLFVGDHCRQTPEVNCTLDQQAR